jgi:hypothetical protein
MVLAGVDYLLPIYHQASSYPALLNEGLEGNPEQVKEQELHQMALELVEPIFTSNQKEAREKFELLRGQESDLTSTDLHTVVRAAKFGQVECLFVPLGKHRWGRYDEKNNKIRLDPHPALENRDLLDFAAAKTLVNSGQVFVVEPENLPGGSEIAAIFRYLT